PAIPWVLADNEERRQEGAWRGMDEAHERRPWPLAGWPRGACARPAAVPGGGAPRATAVGVQARRCVVEDSWVNLLEARLSTWPEARAESPVPPQAGNHGSSKWRRADLRGWFRYPFAAAGNSCAILVPPTGPNKYRLLAAGLPRSTRLRNNAFALHEQMQGR